MGDPDLTRPDPTRNGNLGLGTMLLKGAGVKNARSVLLVVFFFKSSHRNLEAARLGPAATSLEFNVSSGRMKGGGGGGCVRRR